MTRHAKTHPPKCCLGCGVGPPFDRSYGFHAGHSDLGFLYNDKGDEVFIWSSFDKDYQSLVGHKHPWTLNAAEQARVEEALLPSPGGTRWRFRNPARCTHCGHPISGPMTETIYGLGFDGRQHPDDPYVEIQQPFATYLRPAR